MLLTLMEKSVNLLRAIQQRNEVHRRAAQTAPAEGVKLSGFPFGNELWTDRYSGDSRDRPGGRRCNIFRITDTLTAVYLKVI